MNSTNLSRMAAWGGFKECDTDLDCGVDDANVPVILPQCVSGSRLYDVDSEPGAKYCICAVHTGRFGAGCQDKDMGTLCSQAFAAALVLVAAGWYLNKGVRFYLTKPVRNTAFFANGLATLNELMVLVWAVSHFVSMTSSSVTEVLMCRMIIERLAIPLVSIATVCSTTTISIAWSKAVAGFRMKGMSRAKYKTRATLAIIFFYSVFCTYAMIQRDHQSQLSGLFFSLVVLGVVYSRTGYQLSQSLALTSNLTSGSRKIQPASLSSGKLASPGSGLGSGKSKNSSWKFSMQGTRFGSGQSKSCSAKPSTPAGLDDDEHPVKHSGGKSRSGHLPKLTNTVSTASNRKYRSDDLAGHVLRNGSRNSKIDSWKSGGSKPRNNNPLDAVMHKTLVSVKRVAASCLLAVVVLLVLVVETRFARFSVFDITLQPWWSATREVLQLTFALLTGSVIDYTAKRQSKKQESGAGDKRVWNGTSTHASNLVHTFHASSVK